MLLHRRPLQIRYNGFAVHRYMRVEIDKGDYAPIDENLVIHPTIRKAPQVTLRGIIRGLTVNYLFLRIEA